MILLKRYILPLGLLILLLSSRCEFNPHDVPETKIDKPLEGPPIFFRLNDFSDTIKLGWIMNFQYNILGTKNKILSVKVNFEGTEIHHYVSGNGQSFSFEFDPSPYSNGNYQLTVEIISGTGSGSIADKVGAEGYLYTQEWPVLIDKTLPDRSLNGRISENQTAKGMELTWTSFNHPNFISYQVCRQYNFIQDDAIVIATINDPLNTKFIDSTFWEGTPCIYHIRINTPAGLMNGDFIWAFPTLGLLQAKLNSDKTIDVSWEKSKNLESFGKYYIYAGSSSSCIFDTRLIDNPDQNTTKFNFGAFGSSLYIYLKFVPPGVTEPYYRYLGHKMIELIIPPIIPAHIASFSVMERDFVLLADRSAIYRYYPKELSFEDSFAVNLLSSCPMTISNNGSRFIYYSNGKFYVRQTDDFFLENEFSGPLPETQGREMISYTLSDNFKMLALDNTGISYLYDIRTGDLIDQDTLIIDGYNATTIVISNDGTKLVAKSNILNSPAVFYKYEQAGWTESGRSDSATNKFLYSADGSLIYVTYTKSIQIRDADDFSIVKSYLLPYGYFQCADIENDRFLWNFVGTEHYMIGDLGSGTTIRSLSMGNTSSLNLFDNYIIASNGYQLRIPEF